MNHDHQHVVDLAPILVLQFLEEIVFAFKHTDVCSSHPVSQVSTKLDHGVLSNEMPKN